MKKVIGILIICILALSSNAAALADDGILTQQEAQSVPVLSSISFKNAEIEGEFLPYVNEYELTLENPEISPTLEDFKIEGKANLFINYMTDEAHRQTGICATIEFESGSTIYKFNYANADTYKVSDNNYLSGISGKCVDVYPEITRKNTNYRLYIPSDMTVLKLSGITEDVSAYCGFPAEIEIAPEQEPVLPVTVTASNGETRLYKFTVKRVNKTTKEVEELMSSDDFTTLAEDEIIYKNPVFYIVILGVAAGLFIVLLMISIAKRISVKAEDSEETEFFD